MSDNNAFSIILLVVVFLYVVSPLDFVPGPVDDIVLMLMCMRAKKSDARLFD